MGTFRPGLKKLLLRVSGYLNARLSLFASLPTTTMSTLPNIREFADTELVESDNDSEELLSLKFKEQMRRKWEEREQERRECE